MIKKLYLIILRVKVFGDDPKYIAEELLQRNLDLKMIWVTRNVQINLPDKICAVKYGTIRAAYHWITAKVWVDNVKSTIRPAKGKGNITFRHGTLLWDLKRMNKMRQSFQLVILNKQ